MFFCLVGLAPRGRRKVSDRASNLGFVCVCIFSLVSVDLVLKMFCAVLVLSLLGFSVAADTRT